MPFPIMPMNDRNNLPDSGGQDMSNLIPLIMNPLTVLQDYIQGDGDKKIIKEIWLKSESLDDGSLKVSSSIPDRDLMELKGRGLISGNGRCVSFTEKGHKILRDSILNDEKSSLSKQASLVKRASKRLIAKNSYDFGDHVLVRTNKEKIGARYVSVSRSAFKKKSKAEPKKIQKYTFATRNEDGTTRGLKDYSEEELVQILHLANKIMSSKSDLDKVFASRGEFLRRVPVGDIKNFMGKVIAELDSR